VRAQAQPAPKPVEKEHAQRPAKDIGQGMKNAHGLAHLLTPQNREFSLVVTP
jgi:hypothetical protein